MKKLAVGCLVILVLAGAALAVGAFYLYRAARPVVQNARDYVERVRQLGDIDQRVANSAPFTPPANGELTKDEVERFARVQQHIRDALGGRFKELDAKYRNLQPKEVASHPPSLSEVVSAFVELGSVATESRRFRVDALNQERFSSDEYIWVRQRVYQAAGVEATSVVDFQKIAETIRNGTGINSIEVPKTPLANVPPRNRELVKPYLSKMDEWLPLLFFGL